MFKSIFKNSLIIFTFLALLSSCSNDDEGANTIQSGLPFIFFDDFNNDTAGEIDNLFPDSNSRWSNIQQVNPNNGDNEISLVANLDLSNDYVLRFLSKPSDEILSKIDIEKGGFFADIGSKVEIDVEIFINSDENLEDLFLIDLECCSCWDPDVPDNQCPGIRLKMGGDNNLLSIERGKIIGPTIINSDVSFPLNEWVSLSWDMTLSPEEDGENILLINGEEAIRTAGFNMPNSDTFREEFASFGIDFSLQEPLGYERLQIGATANPTAHEVEIFIDNFSLVVD